MGSCPSDNKYPQFFKVFQPQHSSDSLRIPRAFIDKINGKIPDRVFLRNRSGNPELVHVVKIGDQLHFQGGWSKFVLKNSLRNGEFMVFKYNGQRIFDVILLGRNGCEKELVDDDVEEEEQVVEEQGVDGDDVVDDDEEEEDGDDDSEDDDSDNDDDDYDEEGEEDEEMDNTKLRKLSSKRKSRDYIAHNDMDEDDMHTRKLRKIFPMKYESESIAREGELRRSILKYLPKENPYFTTTLKKSEYERDRLMIPKSVILASNLEISNNIVLIDPEGRNWGGTRSIWQNGQVWVQGGWKSMCEANKVREKDTIICELLPQISNICDTIKVQIINSDTVKGN